MTSAAYLLLTGDSDRGKHRAHHPVVVPGPSQGGSEHLGGAMVDDLIIAESAGAQTILVAQDLGDLDSVPAAVCRYVATDSPAVAREATARYGAERVLQVRSAALADTGEWIGDVPRPVSRRLGRRIRRAARKFSPARALYARIRAGR